VREDSFREEVEAGSHCKALTGLDSMWTDSVAEFIVSLSPLQRGRYTHKVQGIMAPLSFL
jgi:hypothetical protein